MTYTHTNLLNIGLVENCCHSLRRGYELWNEGYKTKNGWLLKEAIIWVHHGIELGLKQLLVQVNEFLVFEDIDKAVEKLLKLPKNTSSKKTNATALDLFEADDGPQSVGFQKLVKRVCIMLDLQELKEGEQFRINLDALTKYRNKITHFSIELKIEETAILLENILQPLLQIFKKHIKSTHFIQECIPSIEQAAKPVIEIVQNLENEVGLRVRKMMEAFSGQEISGNLFGINGNITLPHFTGKVDKKDAAQVARFGIDLIAQSQAEKWLVDIHARVPGINMLQNIIKYKEKMIFSNSKTWFIFFSELPPMYKKIIRDRGYYVSDILDIEQLEKILHL